MRLLRVSVFTLALAAATAASASGGIVSTCSNDTNGSWRVVAAPEGGAGPSGNGASCANSASSGGTCDVLDTTPSDPCYCTSGGPRVCRVILPA